MQVLESNAAVAVEDDTADILVDFGTVLCGREAVDQTVVVSNAGNTPLVYALTPRVIARAPDAPRNAFSVLPSRASVLGGDHVLLTARFLTPVAGLYRTVYELRMPDEGRPGDGGDPNAVDATQADDGPPVRTFTLAARAAVPILELETASHGIDFGVVLTRKEHQQSIQLRNVGGYPGRYAIRLAAVATTSGATENTGGADQDEAAVDEAAELSLSSFSVVAGKDGSVPPHGFVPIVFSFVSAAEGAHVCRYTVEWDGGEPLTGLLRAVTGEPKFEVRTPFFCLLLGLLLEPCLSWL